MTKSEREREGEKIASKRGEKSYESELFASAAGCSIVHYVAREYIRERVLYSRGFVYIAWKCEMGLLATTELYVYKV